jgi:HAD superfamily hydrolase (TIGR01450 family)
MVDQIKVLLLDGDGVIWIDKTPIPGAIESLNKIRSLGIRLVLVTNNCSKTREQYLQFMEGMGLKGFTVDDIFSSGYVTSLYLKSNGISEVYVSGFVGLMQELRQNGIKVHTIETDPEPQPVQAVIAAKSEIFTYQEISRGIELCRRFGAKLIATNRDPNFPLAHGVLVPGSGAVGRTFEVACQCSAIWIGKPENVMFDTVLRAVGVGIDDVMMVGDRLMTDIAFASRRGARSVLVLSGIDTEDMAKKVDPEDAPTYILPSLVDVAQVLESLGPVSK